MRLTIISGLAGSGKSVALHMLEDLGYYCVDNLPASLLGNLVEHTFERGGDIYQRTAIGIDARNEPQDIETVPVLVHELRERGVDCDIVFLTASDETLLKRYSETRRKHPLSRNDLSLSAAIEEDRALLAPITDAADLTIDTTSSNVHQLRDMIRSRVDRGSDINMSVLFESFAFRGGVPADADFVFDVRVLPNPYWHQELRSLTGLDQPIVEFLRSQPTVDRMSHDLTSFLEHWIDEFERTNRSYLTVAVGCTGGRHRSVYMVETLAQHFRQRYTSVLTQHLQLPGWSGLSDSPTNTGEPE